MVYNTLSGTSVGATDCGHNVVEISAYTFCANAMGISFGRGKVVGSSEGTSFFSHRMRTKVKAIVYSRPRNIERTISRHCKTQRSRSSALYTLEGTDLLPEWKKDEIETMFMQENIIINNRQIVSRGGAVINVLSDACKGLYSLSTTIEECPDENIFGCTTLLECINKGGVFVIPGGTDTNTPVYTNNGFLIGTVSTLIPWLSTQQGVISVEEVADTSSMPCDPEMVIKIAYDESAVDKTLSFYLSQPRPQNKVIAFQTDYDNPDLIAACNGVDYSGCVALALGVVTYEEEACVALTIGTITYSDSSTCSISMNSVLFDLGGSVVLNTIPGVLIRRVTFSSAQSSMYILPPATGQTSNTHVVISGEETGFVAGLTSEVINSVLRNGTEWLGAFDFEYDSHTDILSKSGGLWDIGDTVEYFYAAGIPSMPYVNRLHVGTISGDTCTPTSTRYITVGNGIIEVNVSGSIFYTGILNNYDPTPQPSADIWVNPEMFNFTIDFEYPIND